jgi:hypothetical protein
LKEKSKMASERKSISRREFLSRGTQTAAGLMAASTFQSQGAEYWVPTSA